jgi:hypothetical protein
MGNRIWWYVKQELGEDALACVALALLGLVTLNDFHASAPDPENDRADNTGSGEDEELSEV